MTARVTTAARSRPGSRPPLARGDSGYDAMRRRQGGEQRFAWWLERIDGRRERRRTRG
jgi:hypothetical protein